MRGPGRGTVFVSAGAARWSEHSGRCPRCRVCCVSPRPRPGVSCVRCRVDSLFESSRSDRAVRARRLAARQP
eukprot:2089007-Prymnesium_polylepis.1